MMKLYVEEKMKRKKKTVKKVTLEELYKWPENKVRSGY
jgi:hypothetical protein